MVNIYMKLNQYEQTEGKVIKLLKKGGGRFDPDHDVIYYPRIKYYDRDGHEYVFELKTGSEHPLAEEGDKIDLFVNPDNPTGPGKQLQMLLRTALEDPNPCNNEAWRNRIQSATALLNAVPGLSSTSRTIIGLKLSVLLKMGC